MNATTRAECPTDLTAMRYMGEGKFYCPACRVLYQRHRLTGALVRQDGAQRYRKDTTKAV